MGDVHNEEEDTESDSDDSGTTVEIVIQIRFVWSLVERKPPLYTRRPTTQVVNALRQEGPSLKYRQKDLRSS